jgi:purine catabolism regulator
MSDRLAGDIGRVLEGMHVADLLALHTLRGTTVVAGQAGLQRRVSNVSVVAGPEITRWVKPGAVLLATGHWIRERPAGMPQIIRELDARSVACIAVRLGTYLDDFPRELLEVAEEVALPVIQLTDNFAFDDILVDVLRQINSALATDLRLAERVHDALAEIVMSGGTATQVAGEAARLLAAEVTLFDPAGAAIPCSPAGEPPAARDWRSLEAAARQPRSAAQTAGPVVLPLGGPATSFGYLVSSRAERAFSPGEVRALERSAVVAALALAQQSAVREVEAQYQGELLAQLFRGELDELGTGATRFRELGWQLSGPIVVAALSVGPGPGGRLRDPRVALWLRSTGAALLRQFLEGRSAVPVIGMVGEYLTVAAPLGRRDQLLGALQRVIDTFHRRSAEEHSAVISAGLSVECSRLADAPRALRQAQVAARGATRRPGPARPCSFGELGALGVVLAAAPDDETSDLVVSVLAPLDRLPARESEGLLATVRALVAENMSLADAARALHCHYNTVRHRARRLEELLGPFTRDPDLRLNITLALRLRDFTSKNG